MLLYSVHMQYFMQLYEIFEYILYCITKILFWTRILECVGDWAERG
jgi:hypothetical protein